MQRISVALILTLLLVSAAWAGQGEWEYLDASAGAISSGYLAVSAVDDNNAFTIGINQFSAYGAQWAWKTENAGETWTSIFQFEGTGDDCDMVSFFTFMLDGDWYDMDHGVVVGMAVPDECLEEFPDMPQCMFACMFRMRSFIWTVTDGGETFVEHDGGGNMTKVAMDLKIIGETIYAGGSNGYFIKSMDFGDSWVSLPSPETGLNSSITDMWWLTPDLGYVATGAPGEADKGEPADDDEAKRTYYAMRDYLDYFRNPIRRMQMLEEGYDPTKNAGDKAQYGNLYKTVDGGHSWEKVYDGDGVYSIYRLQFLDEMNGVVVTDEWASSHAENTIKMTHDGGITWQAGSIPDTGPDNSKYIISDIRMLTPSLGYAAAAHQRGIAASSLVLVTTDGGATWTFDTIGSNPGYTGDPRGYGFMAMDFANNTRGYGVGMNLSVARYAGTNAGPVADAGDDIAADANTVVTLDGSGSSDPDEDLLLYLWTLVDGPADVTLDGEFTAAPTFTATVDGDYTFELQVSDIEYQDTDEMIVTISGGTPVDDDDDDTVGDDDTTDDDDTTAGDDDDASPDAGDDDDDDNDDGCGC
ncbi:MAG: PKD domain-containing protein [Candidatus Lernaella stagnicola]|nr:PKD domain-containing protein [Candidatus Lernaella stagnicola]